MMNKPSKYRRISLLFSTPAVGDNVLFFPTCKLLKTTWPDAHVKVFGANPHVLELAKDCGCIDSYTVHPEIATTDVKVAIDPMVYWLTINSPDLVIAFNEDTTTLDFFNKMEDCGKIWIAYVDDKYGPMALRYMQFVTEDLDLEMPSEEDIRNDLLTPSRRIDLHHKYTFVHLGAKDKWKRWPHFDELLRRIDDPELIVIEGPDEKGLARQIGWEGNVVSGISLADVAALLCNAKLFVGSDSGLMHIAARVGAPTFGIFGPTDPRVWAPFGPQTGHIRTCTAFEPNPTNMLRNNPKEENLMRICFDPDCLKKLSVDEVLDAINQFKDENSIV